MLHILTCWSTGSHMYYQHTNKVMLCWNNLLHAVLQLSNHVDDQRNVNTVYTNLLLRLPYQSKKEKEMSLIKTHHQKKTFLEILFPLKMEARTAGASTIFYYQSKHFFMIDERGLLIFTSLTFLLTATIMMKS